MAASSTDWLPGIPSGEHAEPDTRERTCEKHGAYTSRRIGRIHWSYCPTCCQMQEAEEAARAAADRAEKAARWLQTLLASSGLRGRYAEATFDSYEAESSAQRRVRDAVKVFADRLEGNLILCGPCGGGKTHLLAAATRAAIERTREPAEIITGSELIRRIRATWRSDSELTEDVALERLAGRKLLCVDDVGAGFGTAAEQKTLLDVVDARYQERRPIAVATNLSLPELKAAVGERVFDRLRESAQVLALNWPSHRGRT